MNSRWQDTPLAVLLRLLADLMIANMLGLICSFGVVTAGAGLSAMYAVLFQRERDGGTVSAVKTFFHAFRMLFGQCGNRQKILCRKQHQSKQRTSCSCRCGRQTRLS